jgi:phosphoglycerol transferase MdoB-like AlkP superfamily enzyme
MRWNEIVTEELGVMDMAKSYIMDIIAPLKAQGMNSITVQQIVDQLKKSPDFEGTNIEGDMVNQALQNVKGIKIEGDPKTGQMSVLWDNVTAGRQVDQKQAEKDDKAIKSAALRSADRNRDQ